jgi:hypothetical protein
MDLVTSPGGDTVTCPGCRQDIPLVLAFGFPGERWIKCGDCHLLFGLAGNDEPDDRRAAT